MKYLTQLIFVSAKTTGLALVFSLIAQQTFAGWSVSGTEVRDPNNANFIFRGVNHAHAWYASKTTNAMTDIAATGANSVRVVLSNGDQWPRNIGTDVTNVISQCKAAKLVCVLEVHDSTGWTSASPVDGATNISSAAAYWVSSDIKAALVGQEDYVIVNIANEPFGSGVSATVYTNDTKAAIQTLRTAGLTHLIMVDGSGWGQDSPPNMRTNVAAIFSADTLARTMFSVHMYEVYNTAAKVQDYLTTFKATGYAIIVGEFGTENNGNFSDAASVLLYAQQLGLGYIGWSWSGNGNCCVPLDIVTGFNPATLSTWGELLINSVNGIRATSVLATNFVVNVSSASSGSSTANSVSSASSVAIMSSSASIQMSSVPASTVASSTANSSVGAKKKSGGGAFAFFDLMLLFVLCGSCLIRAQALGILKWYLNDSAMTYTQWRAFIRQA
jgi:mannan endo-1,4-beta-mannosidase